VLPVREALGGSESEAPFDASPETPGPRLVTMDYAVSARNSGAVQRLPLASRPAESRLDRIGLISHGTKRTGERSARNSPATFDAAGAGNVIMAAGLRVTAKAAEHRPAPKVGAPVLDPTKHESRGVSLLCNHLCRRRYRPKCCWGSVGLVAVGGPGCLRGICLRRRRRHLAAASTPRTKMIRPTLHSRQNDLLQVLNRQRALIERFVVKFLEIEGAALCRLIFLTQLPPLPYADEIRWQLR
jgi:hypothetical protein